MRRMPERAKRSLNLHLPVDFAKKKNIGVSLAISNKSTIFAAEKVAV